LTRNHATPTNAPLFEGNLRSLVEQKTAAAYECGALQPLECRSELIAGEGIEFVVRILSRKRTKRNSSSNKANPFLPYDQNLYVSDLTDTHICLLNKFNVLDHHMLIVTGQFEHQERLLTAADFHAISICLTEFDGLGFYNGGVVAGASQPHKHLQYVPVPLADIGADIPMEAVLAKSLASDDSLFCSALPFQNGLIEVPYHGNGDVHLAEVLLDLYHRLLEFTDIDGKDGWQSSPYNLLMTRRWMLLVPRSKEQIGAVSMNALAFAGTLLVSDQEQLQQLKTLGPLETLAQVACR